MNSVPFWWCSFFVCNVFFNGTEAGLAVTMWSLCTSLRCTVAWKLTHTVKLQFSHQFHTKSTSRRASQPVHDVLCASGVSSLMSDRWRQSHRKWHVSLSVSQFSSLSLWEAVWPGDVHVCCRVSAAVPLLRLGQRASGRRPLFCKCSRKFKKSFYKRTTELFTWCCNWLHTNG